MVHLETHSQYSLLSGTASPRQLVARAVEHGMEALALTDTAGLYGAVSFYQAARAAGVRPLLGARLGPAAVLARDREGYAQLCHMVTAWHLGELDAARLAQWPFAFGGERLFVLTDDRALLAALPARGVTPVAMLTHYGDGPSRRRTAALHNYARAHGLRCAAVSPVHFLDPGDHATHRVLRAIGANTTVGQLDAADLAPPEAWFRTPRDLERLYAAWPEALDTTAWIAEECDVELPLGKPLFPEFPLPPGETPFSELWKRTFAGLESRYRPLTPAVVDRVRHELDIIDRLGFAPYFLIVADLVDFARERGIPAVGRGSAANSVAAYALRITRADPMKYDLYFERFLNPGRTDSPDIDLDLCWRRRDEVIDYVYRRYGAERVAMIATHNTFRGRAALREVAKAHGLTDAEIGRVARLLPHYRARDIRHVLPNLPECRGLNFDAEPLRSILDIAERIDGFPRHLSIHAGGVVIAPEALTRFTPLERAPKGILITQYDMHPIEDLGLIKMDLLGHRALTVIDDTVAAVSENQGKTLDVEVLPEPDPRTADMLRRGDTIACFQIESPAMRGLLKKVEAHDIHTLIQCIALVRPGASGSGMKQHFIDRHHGREAVRYPHPALEAVLRETYGVMVYQEDVLKVAHAVAGMDLAEADALRRAMSKKRSPREMAKSMKCFVEGARAQGVADDSAQEIWELVANFAAYSYCKAHAATYGELSYQCAYLKAHYPAEFFAAVLTNRGGFYSPPVYLEEAKRRGIVIRPPHVNHSDYGYRAEGDRIRVGFLEVRGLSHRAIKALLDARKTGGPFSGLDDLHARTGIVQADAALLLRAGAFDGLPPDAPLTRPMQQWQLRALYAGPHKRPSDTRQFRLAEARNTEYNAMPDCSPKRRCDDQWEALGLLCGAHPLDYYLHKLQDRVLIPSTALGRYTGREVTLAGWLITERRLAVKQPGGGVMKFVTLEDTCGAYEAVFFPEAYQRYGHLLTTHGPYLVTGTAQNDHGAPALMVEHVECPPGAQPWKYGAAER